MVSNVGAGAYRQRVGPLAFIGGTGAQGFGLALRFANAGEEVLIGSRVIERARTAAERVRSMVPTAHVHGWTNAEALVRTDRVVLCVPFDALEPFLAGAVPALVNKLVIDVVVPLARQGSLFVLAPVPGAGSVGERIQQAAPAARVVSAFKNLPAALLQNLASPLAGDVVLCGQDPEARATVAGLVARLPGLRAVDAGALVNARSIEAITPLLLNLNRRQHALTSIAIVGLP